MNGVDEEPGRTTTVLRRSAPSCALALATGALMWPELIGLGATFPGPIFVAARPYTAVAAFLWAATTIAVRRHTWCSPVRSAWTTAIVSTMTMMLVLVVRTMPEHASPAASGTVRVLEFNVYDGHADTSALAAAILTTGADLVVLPEAGDGFRKRLIAAPGLAERYRSFSTTPPGRQDVYGLTVLVRASASDVHATVVHTTGRFAWIELSGGELGSTRILALHVTAPFYGATGGWGADLSQLTSQCSISASPAVLVGDFNATLDHHELRDATAGCQDVAALSDRGLEPTWPTWLPSFLGIQIDHIFIPRGVAADGLRIFDLPGSDHRAVAADLRLPMHPVGLGRF